MNDLKIENGSATGYVALYNSPSKILPLADGTRFVEIIRPGAFGASIADRGNTVVATVEHDRRRLLASTKAGSLILREDLTGLHASMQLPPTGYAQDMRATATSGQRYGGSFSAVVLRSDWRPSQPGDAFDYVHEIHELSLSEICATLAPAYAETNLAVRSEKGANRLSAAYRLTRPEISRSQIDLLIEQRNFRERLSKMEAA